MSTIQTKYIGEITIDNSELITFPTGLPGFSEEKSFVLLNLSGDSVFQVLQSATTPNLAFILTEPYHFYEDYVFELDDNVVDTLKISNEKEVVVFSIVTIQEPFSDSTLNLKAPIIVHSQSKVGKQYIIHDDVYSTKAPINGHLLKKAKGDL